MFKTAKNTIKKAAKDQVEFLLVLLTGVFAGSIFTLVYIKYNVKTTLSFADIGGMLASISTLGLLYVAWRTADNWKVQHRESELRKILNNLSQSYSECIKKIDNLDAAITNKFHAVSSTQKSYWTIEADNISREALNQVQTFKHLNTVLELDYENKDLLKNLIDSYLKAIRDIKKINGNINKRIRLNPLDSFNAEFEAIYRQLSNNLNSKNILIVRP
jgi:hypothetical protein